MEVTTNGNPHPRKRRVSVSPMETPNQRFRRLAEYRVTHADRVIAQIINLFGHGYESTEEQRAKITDQVFRWAHSVKAAAERGSKKPTGFKL